MRRIAWITVAWVALCGCEGGQQAPPPAAADAEIEAVRVLLREQRARIDGVPPPSGWPLPGEVRSVARGVWVVDIDNSRLPGGYPSQLTVEVTAAGGHTGRPPR